MKCRFYLHNIWLLCLAVLCTWPLHAVAAPSSDDEATGYEQIWESRLQEITIIESEVSESIERFTALQEPSATAIKKAQSAADTLLSLYKISRRLPSEQLVFVYQMQRLGVSIRQTIVPLKETRDTLDQYLANITTQRDNVVELLNKPAFPQQVGSTERQELVAVNKRLTVVRNTLANTEKKLDSLLEPAQILVTKLEETVATIRQDMPEVWISYYKTRAGVSWGSVITSNTTSTWVSSLSSRLVFTLPQSSADWYGIAKAFGTAMLFFMFFTAAIVHIVQKIPLQQREFLKKYGISPLLWMGLGTGISAAAFDGQGGIYLSFLVGGALFLVWGVVALGWRLRWAVNPSLKGKVSPLAQMFPIAAFGILLLQSDAPPGVLCLIWFVVMLLFSAFVYSVTWRHIRGDTKQPYFEQFVYISSFVVSVFSLGLTIAGYTRLAVLGFIFLIAITNFIVLGFSITTFLEGLIERYVDREEHPVKYSMVEVCNLPISWFIAFCFSLPWVWAVPGSIFIIDHMMHAGYTFGGTSVDFGKILFIGLLFILFRSLTTLASSSLVLISKRLSHIEEGVIPPLQNMMVYGLWAIFALISLATFGVSLTSIAVVAGGLSVGIGFGLQNIFNNFISGIVLIFGRTVLVGDYIEVDGIVGTVRAISIRSTSIETTEMALVYVPNSVIMSGNVINWTRNTRKVRRSITIAIPTENDFEIVAEQLVNIAREQKHVVAFVEPSVQLEQLGMKIMRITLTVVLDDLSNASSTLSAIREGIQKQFIQQQIKIELT